MNPRRKRILLITTGQPSTNPRLVKEADALIEAGYEVKVLYSFWALWGVKTDSELLKTKRWDFQQVGGDPINQPLLYFKTRLLAKLAKIIYNVTGHKEKLIERIFCRAYDEFLKVIRREKADLFIAHNLGAIAIAANAAEFHGTQFAFDAEDFHRGENNYKEFVQYFDTKYFPQAAYITAASPLIAESYQQHFPRINFEVVKNVFSIAAQPALNHTAGNKALSICWFSQTVGSNRGIEAILEAIGRCENKNITLTLIGHASKEIKKEFKVFSIMNGLTEDQLIWKDPVPPDSLFNLVSKFDIGIASEPGFNSNNSYALSNKIFTYIISGTAILISNTEAQKAFYNEYPGIGALYEIGNIQNIVEILKNWLLFPETLVSNKEYCYNLARTQLNWEKEKVKFLNLVNRVI